MTGIEERNAMVFALCHEVGNLLGVVRLNAEWIDEESSGVELARASVEIDDCSTRIRALLGLVRPLLAEPSEDDPGVSASTLIEGVGEALDEYGGRGVSIDVEAADGLPRVRGRPEVLCDLLTTLAYYAIEEARPAGQVRVCAAGSKGSVVFWVEDNGRHDDALGQREEEAPTGRALALAAAEIVLESFGGAVEVRRTGEVTRIELTLPVVD